jgi:ABC-type transporter Mla subunit MlaD
VAVTTGASNDKSAQGKTYKIQFDNAFGLTTGGDLKIGGVRAGKTSSFDLKKIGDGRYVAEVTGKITVSGVSGFHKDASCEIRPQSLIGEYFVDCQPGSSKQMLPSGGTVPVKQTVSTIPPDLLQNVMRRPYRERFRLILAELGTGLAGRPQDVSELLRKAHPGLRETSKVLKILGDQRTVIKNFISNSNIVVRQLDQNKRDVARWIVEAGRAADVSASRRTAIAAGFQRLPTFLDELRGTMVRLEDLTDAQTPLLHNLQAAAPSLTTFLQRLGPFSQASIPAFRSLGKTSDIGKKAFLDSAQEIAELRKLANDAPGAAKPLRQLLQTLDNRDRSFENNPQARQSAPPAPDPTSFARSKGRGFTGLEAILNYAYWQTLSLNEFDSVGHVLRAVALSDPVCSPFQNDLRSAAMGGKNQDAARERCNSYLGPTQPGITTPDPTAGNDNASKLAGTPAAKRGTRKAATKPLPGQTDYSRPHPTLSPSQQDLLNTLGGQTQGATGSAGQAPSSGSDPAGSVSQVLDYLLAP